MPLNAAQANKYLFTGTIILAASGSVATYLNFQGVACLTALNRIDDQIYSPEGRAEVERNCFIMTNSYVYSLFAVVVGLALIAIWAAKRKAKYDDESSN